MNNEKLIEIVKEYKLLYDISDKKYGDNQKKDQAWREIGLKLKTNGKECKKAWALLRDAYRRAVKKRKELKSGQSGVYEKKWRYEDEMSFLLPYIKERQTGSTLASTEGIPDDVEETAEESPATQTNEPSPQPIRSKLPRLSLETPSTILMQYLLENKTKSAPDDVEQFFAGITTTVRSFPAKDRAIAKAKVFEIVSNMEIEILSRPTNFQSNYSPGNSFDVIPIETNAVDTKEGILDTSQFVETRDILLNRITEGQYE